VKALICSLNVCQDALSLISNDSNLAFTVNICKYQVILKTNSCEESSFFYTHYLCVSNFETSDNQLEVI